MTSRHNIRDQYQSSVNLDARVTLHERFSANKQPWMRWVFDHIQAPPDARILEIGCGPGNLWRDNAERISPSWGITLSDFSRGMLEQVRERLAHVNGNVHVCQFDATVLPFGASVFDAVIANHMLYHVSDLDTTLADVHRVLKPTGWFYAATNGASHMQELSDLAPPEIPHVRTGDVIAQFTLDNGGVALERHFEDVNLHRMDNALLVSEAEPLVAYMLSRMSLYAPDQNVDAGQRRALQGHIEAQLRQHGGTIRITKDAGLFIARRA